MMKQKFLEVVRFNLKPGVSPEQLLKAEDDIRKGSIQRQPGYQGREVFQDEHGVWLIIISWDSKEAADAWTPIFMTLPEGGAFASLLEFSSARQEHYSLVEP